MSLNIKLPMPSPDLSPKITVIGVGGAGGNAVNNMIQTRLEGVEFLVTNTDAQALQQAACERRLQLGRSITQGLGAGSRPDVGRAAAEEALDDILTEIEGAHMVFVTAGMGGGTGTGAAPVIARAAREAGILTVGVVTKPFHFEGVHRMRLAEEGITDLTQYVDTLIIIPNQNLFRVANEKTTFADAFKMADDVLESGVRGVTDLMVNPGLINLDFADIRSVMSEMGKAMMGTGDAEGENRAVEAAEAAINNPLLDEISMKGARGVLINITGGMDLTLFEVDEAANRIRDEVDPEANIIFGSTFNDGMESRMRVSVVATGIDADQASMPRPLVSKSIAEVVSRPAIGRPQSVETPAAVAREEEAPAEPFRPAAASMGRSLTDRSLFGPNRATATAHAFAEAPQAGSFEAPEPDLQPIIEPAAEVEVSEPEPMEEIVVESTEAPEAISPSIMEETPVVRQESESFFAPPPATEPEPASLSFERARTRPQPEPFAEAELANAASHAPEEATPNRRSGSLFSRVTGAARALHAASGGGDAARRAQEPSLSRADVPAASRTPEPAAARPAPQPRLTGLEAAEKVRTAEREEELLDIPAFLRRQAN